MSWRDDRMVCDADGQRRIRAFMLRTVKFSQSLSTLAVVGDATPSLPHAHDSDPSPEPVSADLRGAMLWS
ncbi:hypothetical protein PPSIR1_16790 [Plesiocystis pacifica SIR-1]|uniref:Uncharacterized protein n=1 Tax=Plesiocystis pacifica SIR-1 TaxID=391625 RepID=A6G3B3_9BACT|nr:hypothetical protein PPSIR1_16790 [Plesiocystis pacifica SIR-1]